MGKRKLSISLLFVVGLLIASTSTGWAATVTLSNIAGAKGRDGVKAGLYELDIDGQATPGMCDDRLTRVAVGDAWEAIIYDYDDIQAAAAVKFSPVVKYSQAGYLFSLLDAVSLSDQADINLAIWDIMIPGSVTTMTAVGASYFATATSGAYDFFDFSEVMMVVTPDPFTASQEFLIPVAVPAPSAILLLIPGLACMLGLRKKQ